MFSASSAQRFARFLLLVAVTTLCSAHIGSPDAWFNGSAGPYHVLVHVKAPSVVPGIATISVKPEQPVTHVTAFVNKFDAVDGGPPPDTLARVANEPGWMRTELWIMDPGSNSVTVSVAGTSGNGEVVVPLVAVAGRRLQFGGLLSVLLGVAGTVLVAGLLTVVGAAVRESVLPPGVDPDAARRANARRAMVRGTVVVAAVLAGLGVWWRAEDSLFAATLFRPLAVSARAEMVDGRGSALVLSIDDSSWIERNTKRRMRARGGSELTDLIEDHGRLMHLFVIAQDGQTAFAHLHPTTTDSVSFRAALPTLPAGRYRVFADILHSTGFAQTLSTGVTLSAPIATTGSTASADADDGWTIRAPASGDTDTVSNHAIVRWLDGSAGRVAGEEAGLRFSVTGAAGDTASLEPLLGMLGHAVVVRDDGKVFIHLHPMGTISAGAQLLLSRKDVVAHDMSAMSWSRDTLYFPYAFPESGRYTVWVQVKRRGAVQTAAFRVNVGATAEGGKRVGQ